MNNSHISNFGSFGRSLAKFADAHGFVWWDDVHDIENMAADDLVDMANDWTSDNEVRAAAAVELAARGLNRWRES